MYCQRHELAGIRTIFGEEVVRTTDDELRNDGAELLELPLAFRFDLIRGVGIAAANDGVLEVLAEVVLRAKEVGVGEVQEREVFGQIVLQWHIEHGG